MGRHKKSKSGKPRGLFSLTVKSKKLLAADKKQIEGPAPVILKCNGCGHSWASRIGKPVKCPKCSSRRWDA